MSAPRRWTGKVLLHSSAQLRSLRRVPVMGDWIHRLSHRLVPTEQKIWARVETGPAHGLWLEVNPRTGQSYVQGTAETEVQKVLEARLHPGMVFYDLGANLGFFTLLAARRVYPEGHVFSFEPDHEVATRLQRNIAKNQFSNITIIEAGVWCESRLVNFVSAAASSPDRGTGRLDVANPAGKPIRCVALDDFGEGAPPHGIKCDVEGAESEVLLGSVKLIEKHRPWILCEIHSNENEVRVREILSSLDYRLERVDNNHILALP